MSRRRAWGGLGIESWAAALLMALLWASPGRASTILFDFNGIGAGGSATANPDGEGRFWNNVSDNSATGIKITDALDAEGNPTPVDFNLTDTFLGVGAGGTTASSLYPGSATKDYFYVGAGTAASVTGGFRIEGLLAGGSYTFTFYGSRIGVNDSRKTHFTIGAKTVTLQTANNIDGTVFIASVVPDAQGRVTIRVSADPGETAGHLGVLQIDGVFVPEPASLALLGAAGVLLVRRRRARG